MVFTVSNRLIMKKLLMILSALLLICALSGCRKKDSDIEIDSDVPKPEQEILFALERSEYPYETKAWLIDRDGDHYRLPDELAYIHSRTRESDWYEKVIDFKNNSVPTWKVEDKHLKMMYNFANNLDSYAACPLKEYDHTIYDYGTESLYLFYNSPDGTADYKLLCIYGSSTECADSDTVREFVNWMIDNSYFTIFDKDFRY